MNIKLTKEEWEFVLRFCVRAKALSRMNIDIEAREKDLKSIDILIDKLKKLGSEWVDDD